MPAILLAYWRLTRPEGSLLVVEEVDNGLHPSRAQLLAPSATPTTTCASASGPDGIRFVRPMHVTLLSKMG